MNHALFGIVSLQPGETEEQFNAAFQLFLKEYNWTYTDHAALPAIFPEGDYVVQRGMMLTTVCFDQDLTPSKRYHLRKVWDPSRPAAAALMCNPSKANVLVGDGTVDYLMRMVDYHNYGALEVVNLFPLIQGSSQRLRPEHYVCDKENLEFIRLVLERANMTIIAWGRDTLQEQDYLVITPDVIEVLEEFQNRLKCLGYTKKQKGIEHPKYPRFLSINTPVENVRLVDFTIDKLDYLRT